MTLKNRVVGLFCALTMILVAGCGPVGSPSANADHGPPAPANGHNMNPARPAKIPADALELSWHVDIYDPTHHAISNYSVVVRITATSVNAPVQGNVHGEYPFRIFTETPYTHTIWYQPGIKIQTTLTATIDPFLPDGWYVECLSTSGNQIVDANDFSSDPQICISSATVG